MNSALPISTVALLVAVATGSTAAAGTITIRTGVIKLESVVAVSASVPASATISATGSAYFYDSSAGSHQASITAVVKRSGKTASVVLMLPYRWTVGTTSNPVTVTLSVSANSSDSPRTEVSAMIPLPANGATTQVILPAAF